MSSTLPLSQSAPAAAVSPSPAEAQSLATAAAPSFASLCNLRDPAQFKSITVHGFVGEKSSEDMAAMVDAVGTGLTQQCAFPAERIGRVVHDKHVMMPRSLHDKVLVDLRLASSPEIPRVTMFFERKSGPDEARAYFA